MMNRTIAAMTAFALLGACEERTKGASETNEGTKEAPAVPGARNPVENGRAATPPPALPPEPGTEGGLPDDKTPLVEPRGEIDPKSAEAAGQVVQHYGALIEQKRFGEAEKLWGDAGAAKRMTEELKTFSDAHLETGKPTDMEGAAGSTYITVPIVLYGNRLGGGTAHRSGSAVLRRVNDVPGSTLAQRRWHVERLEWKKAP